MNAWATARRWLLDACFLLTLLPAILPAIPAHASEKTLTILAFHRPPYYILENNRPAGGILVEITRKALVMADIPHVFAEAPPKRILNIIENAREYACSVGWFKTGERERFARFSDPIYVGQPMGAAMRPELVKTLPEPPTIAGLMQQKLRMGLRGGFSYGEWLDARLTGHQGVTDLSVTENEQLLEMIARDRIDYTLIDPEEYAWLISRHKEFHSDTTFVALRDIPPEVPRYLMCSRCVPPEVISRINAALAQLQEGRKQPPP